MKNMKKTARVGVRVCPHRLLKLGFPSFFIFYSLQMCKGPLHLPLHIHSSHSHLVIVHLQHQVLLSFHFTNHGTECPQLSHRCCGTSSERPRMGRRYACVNAISFFLPRQGPAIAQKKWCTIMRLTTGVRWRLRLKKPRSGQSRRSHEALGGGSNM